MERHHDILDDLQREHADSRPEVMLGIWLLSTSFFVTGLLVGWVIA